MKNFKEQQKQEMKLLKQELDLLPRDERKESMRRRKEQKEIELGEKVMISVSRHFIFLLLQSGVCSRYFHKGTSRMNHSQVEGGTFVGVKASSHEKKINKYFHHK